MRTDEPIDQILLTTATAPTAQQLKDEASEAAHQDALRDALEAALRRHHELRSASANLAGATLAYNRAMRELLALRGTACRQVAA